MQAHAGATVGSSSIASILIGWSGGARICARGNVIARAPVGDPIEGLNDEDGERHTCWIDDTRIAWLAARPAVANFER